MRDGPIAFIGTRLLDEIDRDRPDVTLVYRQAAIWTARAGRWLHTGAAEGADQLAVEVALANQGPVHLFLPDTRYRRHWRVNIREAHPFEDTRIRETYYDPAEHYAWTQSIARFHPNPAALGAYARRLMARNYGIVVGCGAVVALPRTATDWGGTGQGVRIAQALGIPLYNLWNDADREQLRELVSIDPLSPPMAERYDPHPGR